MAKAHLHFQAGPEDDMLAVEQRQLTGDYVAIPGIVVLETFQLPRRMTGAICSTKAVIHFGTAYVVALVQHINDGGVLGVFQLLNQRTDICGWNKRNFD